MQIAVTGASGLVGSALVSSLEASGHAVVRLVRPTSSRRRFPPSAASVAWDPATAHIEAARLEGLDACVHLAGESVLGRWTPAKKAAIHDSRVAGTRLLARSLADLERPPRVLVCASASGWYGDRGDEVLSEESSAGHGFLATVCRDWEAAATPAREAGIRVVHLRIGVVLSRAGGALRRMLPAFRLGLGGVLGSGRQWTSWIALDDLVGIIESCLEDEDLAGPVNAVSPDPVTNDEFTRTLARVLHRPAVLPVPAAVVRLLLGELGRELLLASVRLRPARLEQSGYAFRHPQLEAALRHLLGAAS